MNKRAVAIGGAVVVGVALVGVVVVGPVLAPKSPEITYLTATASVMDVRDTVSISGSIRPVDSFGLAFGEAAVHKGCLSRSTAFTRTSRVRAGLPVCVF